MLWSKHSTVKYFVVICVSLCLQLSVGENQYVPPNQAKSLSLAPPPYFCLEPGSGEGGACKVDTHSIQKTQGRYTTTKNTIIR